MKYEFMCTNPECKNEKVHIILEVPVQEIQETTPKCEECNQPMARIWGTAIKTGDNFKGKK